MSPSITRSTAESAPAAGMPAGKLEDVLVTGARVVVTGSEVETVTVVGRSTVVTEELPAPTLCSACDAKGETRTTAAATATLTWAQTANAR